MTAATLLPVLDRVNAAHTLTRQSASLSVISRPESTQHTRELSALDCIGRVGDLSLRFEMTLCENRGSVSRLTHEMSGVECLPPGLSPRHAAHGGRWS